MVITEWPEVSSFSRPFRDLKHIVGECSSEIALERSVNVVGCPRDVDTSGTASLGAQNQRRVSNTPRNLQTLSMAPTKLSAFAANRGECVSSFNAHTYDSARSFAK